MEEVDVGHLRIGFERRGTGPPLVLLHGGMSDSREWRRQLEGLSGEFTVIAWDAPGCGTSSDPPEGFRLPDYADCLAGFIDDIGVERPDVLGISFGGGLALELYRRHKDVPRRLVLVSAYAGWAGSLTPEQVSERLREGLKQSEWPPEKVADKWIPTLFSASASGELQGEMAAIISDFHPAGMRAMLRSFAEADLRDVLPLIDIPTLLLYGEHDERSPMDVARELHSKITTSTLVIIPGAGHMCNMESPGAFDSEVRRFLSGISD